MDIGYAATFEQFAPADVVRWAARADAAGFRGVMASDHFQPWLARHGNAAHAWTALGALGAHTRGDLGPGATTPSARMHPAMVAQAAATLEALYPGRTWLGIGSGEAINEHVMGDYWPEAPDRIERMFEAVDLIRKLFTTSRSGRDMRHRGAHFRMESTRLWTMPAATPPLYIATSGPQTARRAGRVADGLVTTAMPEERLSVLLDRFAEGAREAGREPRTLTRILLLHLSWAPTDEEALFQAVAEWPMAGMRFSRSDVRSPFEMEQMARTVRPEDVAAGLVASADPEVHRKQIQRYANLGFDRIYLHNVGADQESWIDVFARDVLPGVRA
jgi:G6PDH family F420-dependent oxidoreductase